MALALAFAACAVLGIVAARPAAAHEGNKLRGSCVIDQAAGRATVTLDVANVGGEPVNNVAPKLTARASGSATFFIQTAPRPEREILPNRSEQFAWKGRFYGDGYLDLTVQVRQCGGQNDTSGLVNCNRVAVGNPTDPLPTATTRSTNTRSSAPQTPRPTNTPAGRPTRTPITPRPTRTRAGDPTVPPTARPTQTGTRLATSTRPPNTPTHAQTARTPFPPTATPAGRPTRTRAAAPTPRPTRTPPRVTPATPTPIPPIGDGTVVASCSLRRSVDSVTITLLVENRSGGVLHDIRASTLQFDPEGGALFFDQTGPSPSLVRDLSDGSSTAFQWTGRLSPGGTMGFSAFATGTAAHGSIQTRLIDCGVTAVDGGNWDPANFDGECSISPGENGEVAVHIRNGLRETLTNVEVGFVSRDGTGNAQVANIRGPAPRVVASLLPGARRKFVFGAHFEGNGDVTMRFVGRANRVNSQRIETATIECGAYVGGRRGGDLPDLGIDANELQSSLQIQTQNFPADHCAVVEGCVDGTGNRKLLRFNTVTPNFGPGDVFLGDPVDNPSFEYSACHNHYHFVNYASYRLLDMSGRVVARGHKQAFCLLDLWKYPGLGGDPRPQFPLASSRASARLGRYLRPRPGLPVDRHHLSALRPVRPGGRDQPAARGGSNSGEQLREQRWAGGRRDSMMRPPVRLLCDKNALSGRQSRNLLDYREAVILRWPQLRSGPLSEV